MWGSSVYTFRVFYNVNVARYLRFKCVYFSFHLQYKCGVQKNILFMDMFPYELTDGIAVTIQFKIYEYN